MSTDNKNKPCPITGEVTCHCSTPVTAIKNPTLKEMLRKLFTDHGVITKMYITSAIHNLPDKDAITNRLLRNQEDIGNGVKKLVGEEAGNILTSLLKDHILKIAAALDAVLTVKAMKDDAERSAIILKEQFENDIINRQNLGPLGDKFNSDIQMLGERLDNDLKIGEQKLNTAINAVMKNAEEVGSFLYGINTYFLTKDGMIAHFKKHNEFVLEIATEHLNGDYVNELKTYDAYYNHILYFSDVIWGALANKFGVC